MLNGQIVRIISNLFTVKTKKGIYDCRARGKFRLIKVTPLVGDYCVIDENEKYILEIDERKNELKRPMIANVDIALIITSVKEPDLSLNLLDKLISVVTINHIEPVVCFTKLDLIESKEEIKIIKDYYNQIGIKTFYNTEIDAIKKYLKQKLVVLTGQTGAGKSTFLNKIDPELNIKTSPISKALGRGVHTTRHSEIFEIENIHFADTPGFSALDLNDYEAEQIKHSFIEFFDYQCQYRDCNHLSEKKCGVKEAVQKKLILSSRYENYEAFYKEGKK